MNEDLLPRILVGLALVSLLGLACIFASIIPDTPPSGSRRRFQRAAFVVFVAPLCLVGVIAAIRILWAAVSFVLWGG